MHDGLKSVLEIWIPDRLDQDLFGPIWILIRAMAVCGPIFHSPSQIRIRVTVQQIHRI
jgi:hypothetical protein